MWRVRSTRQPGSTLRCPDDGISGKLVKSPCCFAALCAATQGLRPLASGSPPYFQSASRPGGRVGDRLRSNLQLQRTAGKGPRGGDRGEGPTSGAGRGRVQ